ncbi:MAG TPA: glycosyltransferase family 4 protein [Thermoanaerobaculia bacterium]|nr:glycosyltransferase family 4 protein [Thermoanaerobaculia bacterium]
MSPRAAYFLLTPDYFGRPFDDGIIRALLAARFEVDLYMPPPLPEQTLYPPQVTCRQVDYRLSWLRENLRPLRWRRYDLLLGCSDLPMAVVGLLGRLARRPTVTACDEIYSGGYEGQARLHWKTLVKSGMHRADLTVITDLVRTALQREYARLPASHPFVEYPCCFADDFDAPDRTEVRRELGIGEDDFVVSMAGRFSPETGALQGLELLDRVTDASLLVQTAGRPDALTDALLRREARRGRLVYAPERLGYRESLRITSAADVSLVVYLSPKPQFQAMGVSSNKLCLSLWMGIPVIATRQPSFELVERYRCGVLIDGDDELPAALETIRANRAVYSENARAAVREHIRPAQKLEELASTFASLAG